ncbi:MAG: hypothetical protein M3461_19330 [Pseudomonadota bacterium]|nr:hypothetical protein [Pseudomonadota bacterium]
MNDGLVRDVYPAGFFNHVIRSAALCARHQTGKEAFVWEKSIFCLPEKKPTKRWRLGVLSLISAMIAAASLVSAPPAAAKPAAQGVTATLNVRLQSIRLAFKTFPNRKILRWCIELFGVYALCALMIGLLTGFCRLELMNPPVA